MSDTTGIRARAGLELIRTLGHTGGILPAKSPIPGLIPSPTTHRPSISDLEKHIDDYKRGLGYLSKEVGSNLSVLDRENSFALSPDNSSKYLGYLSGLRYDQRARFVDSLNGSLENTKRITGVVTA